MQVILSTTCIFLYAIFYFHLHRFPALFHLDGSNILAEIFPRVAEFYWKIRPYSMWILLLLLGTGILDVPISLLNSAVINGMWSFVKAILRIGVVTTGGGTVI